ncbi:fimbria/pilus outer membrane usher protein [Undibacterium sp. TJN19]|uniref:fimbria/pilus outer membrane usher protein n=1 Tax=Undibacterium sp. TJN19 TaxID=3413055 RepID=UPI003BF22933
MKRVVSYLILMCVIASGPIWAQALSTDEILFLEVSVNGHPTQAVSQFIKRNGKLYIPAEELKNIGVRLPAAAEKLLAVASFSNDIQVDLATQKINITVKPDLLSTTELSLASQSAEQVSLADKSLGAVFNYDVLATQTNGRRAFSGMAETRIFNGPHVFSSTGLAYAGEAMPGSVRLDTSYSYANPDNMRRYLVGDFVSNGLTWTRPVRMGGAQVSTDFSLRPDLVLFPTPSLRGEAVVASNVDLFLNGIRQLSESVPPGPFEIRQAPIATGAGSMAIAVTDALGRQAYKTIPFYASEKLLREGLISYSVEAGSLRKNYGLQSNDYGPFVASTSVRYGYSPVLTLEGHLETRQGLQLAGLGMATTIHDWGVLAAAASASNSDAGSGRQYAISFERRAATASFSFSKMQADKNYRDIGAMSGSPVPRSILTAGAGLFLQQYGSLNLTYTAIKTPQSSTTLIPNMSGVDAEIISLTYFKSIFNRANLFLTAYKNRADQNYGVTVGLVMPFGLKDSFSSMLSSGGGLRNLSLQASHPSVLPGDFGWQLQDAEGGFSQRLAEINYKGNAARASFAVSQSGNVSSERVSLRGAITWADNSVFLSNWIDDSFAIVNTNGIKDVGIYAENRMVGRTDNNGQLLIPDLRAYEINKISIDMSDLPMDVQVDVSEKNVKPQDRSGVIVHFKLARTLGARIILRDRDGRFLPVGTVVSLKDTGAKAIVGYDGETYFPELQDLDKLEIITPTGASCKPGAGFIAQKESIPLIGPLTCV